MSLWFNQLKQADGVVPTTATSPRWSIAHQSYHGANEQCTSTSMLQHQHISNKWLNIQKFIFSSTAMIEWVSERVRGRLRKVCRTACTLPMCETDTSKQKFWLIFASWFTSDIVFLKCKRRRDYIQYVQLYIIDTKTVPARHHSFTDLLICTKTKSFFFSFTLQTKSLLLCQLLDVYTETKKWYSEKFFCEERQQGIVTLAAGNTAPVTVRLFCQDRDLRPS